MTELLEMLISFFGLSLVAVGAQNAIFTRGQGLSSGLRMLSDSRKSTGWFCVSLTVFQLMTSIIVYFAMLSTLSIKKPFVSSSSAVEIKCT